MIAFVVNSNIMNNVQSVSNGSGVVLKLEKTSIATAFSEGISNNGVIISWATTLSWIR